MERKFRFAEGEYYHIYNRGVEKRDIFTHDADRSRFIRLLYLSNGDRPYVYRDIQGLPLDEVNMGQKKTAIGAYCLMPNHFHLLLKEVGEGGISHFMEKLTTGYSMYFNKKYGRVGPLFQGRFKAEHVDRDEYLKYLYAYIHLNPVKLIDPKWKEAGIQNKRKAKEYLVGYPYSSYLDYTKEKVAEPREEALILTPGEFPDYFEKRGDFDAYIEDWLDYRDEAEPVA